MTTLDKQALEKAVGRIAEITKYACTDEAIAREAIRAYIAALPEARTVWIETLKEPFIHAYFLEPRENTKPFEIREVRQP